MRSAFVLSLLSMLLLSCTRGGNGYYGATQPKHGPDEAWSNFASEPETIDPSKAAEQVGGTLILNMFSGLTQGHPQTLDPMPDVAERWDISEDGRRYVFHLRKSTWSDGVPLTAADFEYTWRRVLDPKTGSRYASFLFGLKNGELFNRKALCIRAVGAASEAELRGVIEPLAAIEQLTLDPALDAAFVIIADPKARARVLRELPGRVKEMDGSEVGVHAQDDSTLVVDLEVPLPFFLHITKYYTAMPVPRHLLERLEREGQPSELWSRPENIVSNGPYLLAEAKFRQFMRLEKNPRYWDAEHVKLQRIRLSLIENYNTTLNMYEAGELDTIGPATTLPAEFFDVLRTHKDFFSAPYESVYFYWVNHHAPPVDNRLVRQALSLAIDRESLVRHVTRAGQIPSADIVPDGLGGYQALNTPFFDPERARALLREAGYGPEHPLPTVTLRYNTSEGHRQVAEAVQAMWRKHLGISAEIENQEWKVYLKSLETRDYQLGRFGWIGDYPDPFTFLELFTAHNGNNRSGWSSREYDELLRQANFQRDPAQRLAKLREAELIFARELPVIPLYVYTRSELIKPYLRGHTINYECRYMYKYWFIDERWYTSQPDDLLPHGFPPMPAKGGG
jgi:oligopeptide transport system substrate-binding protein